jgi:hypothetical protein
LAENTAGAQVSRKGPEDSKMGDVVNNKVPYPVTELRRYSTRIAGGFARHAGCSGW